MLHEECHHDLHGQKLGNRNVEPCGNNRSEQNNVTVESETYARGFSVVNIATPIIYCIIRYATAAETEILPLANGLFFVRSTRCIELFC